jgi:hypothetical protein
MFSLPQKKRLWIPLFILLLIFSPATRAAAGPVQSAPGLGGGSITLQAEVGYEGFYRRGAWNPVRVEIANNGPSVSGRVEVLVLVGPNNRQASYAQEISLPNTSRKTLTLYVYIESSASRLLVRFHNGKSVLMVFQPQIFELPSTGHLAGVMAGSSTPFDLLPRVTPGSNLGVARIDPAALPELSSGLDILNELYISDIDTGALSTAQRRALAEWVGGGGQLWVFGGPEWRKTTAGLGDLLPVQIQGTASLSALDDLARLGEGGQPLAGEMVAAQSTPLSGAQVLARSGDTPLVVVRARGSGRVIFLAFDPALEPFASWAGKESFYRLLLSHGLVRPDWSWGFQSPSGVFTGLSRVPGQELPYPLVVLGFLLAYVGVVGPLNFWLVRKIKRRELAWVTIPAVVAVFCAAAFGLGILGLGSQPVVNQWFVMQSSSAAETGRVYGGWGLYSPSRRAYSMQMEAPFLFGPYNPAMQSLESEEMRFTQQPEGGTLNRRVALDQGGFQMMHLQGQAPAPRIDAQLRLDFKGSTLTLSGELVNNSAQTLQDALLISPCGEIGLGRLEPARRLTIHKSCPLNAGSRQYNFAGGNQAQSEPIQLPSSYSIPQAYESTPDIRRGIVAALIGADSSNSPTALGFSYPLDSSGAVTLLAWSDAPLAAASLNSKAQQLQHSLYLVRLDAEMRVDPSEPLEIGPALYTFQVIGRPANMPNASSLVGQNLAKGMLDLSFTPVYLLPFRSVQALKVVPDIVGNGSMKYSLWDFQSQAWEPQLLPLAYGVQIDKPARYVGPLGEVRVRIENTGPAAPTFQGVRVTLTVIH